MPFYQTYNFEVIREIRTNWKQIPTKNKNGILNIGMEF